MFSDVKIFSERFWGCLCEVLFELLEGFKSLAMGRKAELSKEKQAQIWILEQEGLFQRVIPDRVDVSQSTVSVTLCRCREMEGTYASRKRSGRPSVVTPINRNQLRVMIKKSPKASSSKLQTQLPQSNIISQRTIKSFVQWRFQGLSSC